MIQHYLEKFKNRKTIHRLAKHTKIDIYSGSSYVTQQLLILEDIYIKKIRLRKNIQHEYETTC